MGGTLFVSCMHDLHMYMFVSGLAFFFLFVERKEVEVSTKKKKQDAETEEEIFYDNFLIFFLSGEDTFV